MGHLSFLRRAILAAFVGLLAVALPAKPIAFELPAQPLADALVAFSKQSGADVLFSFADLKDVRSAAVVGEHEPERALDQLLRDTGFKAVRNEAGKFVITKAPARTGSVRGALLWPEGGAAEGVSVFVRETGQSTRTDRQGQYVFAEVPAGTFLLVAKADGYQPLHLTDVNVRAGQDLILSRQTMRRASDLTRLEPFSVTAEAVTTLSEYEVTDSRTLPFSSANLDLPRTINDAQPYYIFDAEEISQSGAVTLEEFFRREMPMSTSASANADFSGNFTMGSLSSINLRGLGADKTLILVNGRRIAGVKVATAEMQPDLNGIPLNSVERVEVLPTSAAAIYGGGAVGGAINIILKRDYAGGGVHYSYSDSFDGYSPINTAGFNWGQSLEGGRTHFTVSGQWTDTRPLVALDRQEQLEAGIRRILAAAPELIFNATTGAYFGALPNIRPQLATQTTLTFKNGAGVIPSRLTHIPAGTSASTPLATLRAGLLANAGQWNYDLPLGTQTPGGLLRTLGQQREMRGVNFSFRRQMRPGIEAFLTFSRTESNSRGMQNPFSMPLNVPATASTNPFTTAVSVAVPNALPVPQMFSLDTAMISTGLNFRLPGDWRGQSEFNWTNNRYESSFPQTDTTALTLALANGSFNPFVDALLYPQDLGRFLGTNSGRGATETRGVNMRAAGPLPALSWGSPTLTLGAEWREEERPYYINDVLYPITTRNNTRTAYYPKRQRTESVYLESLLPLSPKGTRPGLHSLELQVAGRYDRYVAGLGTNYTLELLELGTITQGVPTQGGKAVFYDGVYESTNYTLGLKYQPREDVTLRVSSASAFTPPTGLQLSESSEPGAGTVVVQDPRMGGSAIVRTITGGNASLKPQSSTSLNAGIIWEPRWAEGLRVNVEYYRIKQQDRIATLTAQQVVTQEATYPDRVVRDAAGFISIVNISNLNLYQNDSEGLDLSVSYRRKTAAGTFTLKATDSVALAMKTQYALAQPMYDAAGYSTSDGGTPRHRGTASLAWQRNKWTLRWNTRYTHSFKVYGAAGGPSSLQNANGGVYLTHVAAQGRDTIPSQTYHDVLAVYDFGRRPEAKGLLARALDGLSLQAAVSNLFDRVPPFDTSGGGFYTAYTSTYESIRLRTYTLTLRKQF